VLAHVLVMCNIWQSESSQRHEGNRQSSARLIFQLSTRFEMTSRTPFNKLHAAFFAGAVAVFAAAPSAHAIVVYVVPAVPIPITNSIDGVYFNLVTGATGSSGAAVSGWDINPYNNGAGLTMYGAASPSGILATGTPGTLAVATPLAFGAVIGPAGQYNQFQTVGTGFQTAGLRYVGLRFQNEALGLQNYGWLQINSGAGAGFPASIVSYGYETDGGQILAGAVPEPSTYAMFGLALAAGLGLRGWRNRRMG